MSYLDIGFDQFLNKVSQQTEIRNEPVFGADQSVQEITGTKIQGGVISSPNGQTKFDLEQGRFIVNDGVEDVVQLGILPDGTVGLLIRNGKGQTLMQITETVQVIQSPNEHFQVNFAEEHILSKDDTNTPRALFGKGEF